MSRLGVFNSVSLDGYFTGANGDLSWAHNVKRDAEWDAFVAGNASGGGQLLLGRITYELMMSYWPTPEAKKNDPVVAEAMNNLPKVVFSRTLDKAVVDQYQVGEGRRRGRNPKDEERAREGHGDFGKR